MRIVIDTCHPAPRELRTQLEAILTLHDPDPQVAVQADAHDG